MSEYAKVILYLFGYTDIDHWTLCIPYYTKGKCNLFFYYTDPLDATVTKEHQPHKVFRNLYVVL